MTARPNCPAVIFSTLRRPPEATLRHPKRPEATRSDTKRPEATQSDPELRSGERCDRGSDPPVTPSKARLATEGLTQCRAQLNEAPVLHTSERSEHELLSDERCDRGSDPTVTPSEARLATEGLTQCRATMNESPILHRSERSEHAPPLQFLRCPSDPAAASFPTLRSHLSVATGGQTRCCQPSKLGGTSGQTPAATRRCPLAAALGEMLKTHFSEPEFGIYRKCLYLCSI